MANKINWKKRAKEARKRGWLSIAEYTAKKRLERKLKSISPFSNKTKYREVTP